jgi:uncharacterized membrane protein
MLGLSGVALFRIAQASGLSLATSMLLVALLLCHPSFHGASSGINLYGYHPDCLLPIFYLFAYDAYLRRRRKLFWVLVIFTLATLEQAGIVLSATAIYWIFTGDRRLGFKLLAVSVAWFLLATKIAIPIIGGTSKPYYFSALKKPADFCAIVGIAKASALYGLQMVLLFLAFPLLSLFSLVAMPSTLIYAQAQSVGYGIPLHILSWHAVPVVSVLSVSSVNAISLIETKNQRLQKWNQASLMLGCCILFWISYTYVYKPDIPQLSEEQRAALRQLKNDIPEQASLSANYFAASHFSHRKDLFIWSFRPQPIKLL